MCTMKKSVNISKINQLVLRGLIAEDQELFLNRLGIIIDRANREVLEQLAEGIIVGARITDMEAAKAWVSDRNKGKVITEITSVDPTSETSVIRINYKYEKPAKWFATEKQAEHYACGYSEDGVSKQDPDHPYEGTYSSNSSESCQINKDWLEIEKL